ncbi:MAG: hypothetical protein REI09_00345 [Candidatus Dactylopiibacterium sp.]|nr:hypothetical protein [Candidatus Dactylopiibacterium sp.]
MTEAIRATTDIAVYQRGDGETPDFGKPEGRAQERRRKKQKPRNPRLLRPLLNKEKSWSG